MYISHIDYVAEYCNIVIVSKSLLYILTYVNMHTCMYVLLLQLLYSYIINIARVVRLILYVYVYYYYILSIF